MTTRQLWYTRRGVEIRGPYPAQQISRFILLGRILETDEISTNQTDWQPVTAIPVLIPEELKADLSDPTAHQRLLIARMREDERDARERRETSERRRLEDSSELDQERRQDDDRRHADERRRREEEKMIRHREIKSAIAEAARERKNHYFLRGVLSTVFLIAVIGLAWYYQPWVDKRLGGDVVDCNAPPQPWVNYSNCIMEGVRLASSDLRGARMRNANIAGGDFRSSLLSGADLAYTSLVMADLSGAVMNQVVLVGSNLRNGNMHNADLEGANLAYAILQGVNLDNADLSNADLTNADLTGASINNLNLSGAKLDNTTWVDGSTCQAGSIGECLK